MLETIEAETVWETLTACYGQVRFAGGGMAAPRAVALDYGAIMAFARVTGADLALLADVLPAVESSIIESYRPDDAGEGDV